MHLRLTSIFLLLVLLPLSLAWTSIARADQAQTGKQLIYITSDRRIPFWDIMSRGIQQRAQQLGYQVQILSANNSTKRELEHLALALRQQVDGLIISPTSSSAGATLIKLASAAGIPVVVADIGADSDKYLSFIASDNYQGAYELGRILGSALIQKGWQSGRVGIVAIPQRRQNGRERTAGFMQALDEAGILAAGMRQQVDFSYTETYTFSRELIDSEPELRALWLQGSDRYQAALDAIKDAGREGEILLATFDAEPEFIDMIQSGQLIGAAMQQPFLIGEEAVISLDRHFHGESVTPEHKLSVLAVSADNLQTHLPTIRRNVLGQQVTP
ncbi:substrate-binding domain-containing protein [Marinobacterium stanieri]|uniref:substrate-binding domain-containing protein n=1 Tax=Marinobacterium stanieri TaxID=49186 RepID=UPI003A9464EC